MKRVEPKTPSNRSGHPITSISLTHELHEQLNVECARTGMNKSELIRSILDIYFEED